MTVMFQINSVQVWLHATKMEIFADVASKFIANIIKPTPQKHLLARKSWTRAWYAWPITASPDCRRQTCSGTATARPLSSQRCLNSMHWLTVYFRIQYKLGLLMHSATTHCCTSSYISDIVRTTAASSRHWHFLLHSPTDFYKVGKTSVLSRQSNCVELTTIRHSSHIYQTLMHLSVISIHLFNQHLHIILTFSYFIPVLTFLTTNYVTVYYWTVLST